MAGDIPKFSLLKFRTLIRDTRGPSEAVSEVLHAQDELDDYLASCQDKPGLKQPVAFPDEKAVAVALGSRPTTGYGVEIIAVVQETGGFVGVQHHVLYTEQAPHGIAADHVTFPQHVIRVRGLGGIVSFRHVADSIGHSLAALTAAATGPGAAPPAGNGGNGHATTLAVGEEGAPPTTLATGEEGTAPTTLAAGEMHLTSLYIGEETPPTAHAGEHPTTLGLGEEMHVTSFVVGEEAPPTAHAGEHPTTFGLGEEHHVTSFVVGEEMHVTSLYVGEETLTHPFGEGHSGGGGPRGPFG